MIYRAVGAFVFFTLLAGPAVADDETAGPKPDRATLSVARHLDVLSIPSSIYPRRRKGANTLADYGFVDFTGVDGGVQSTLKDKSWLFGIKIVADNGGIKILCIRDQALNNGSYLSQSTMEVKIGSDGLFHGTGRTPINPQCPPYQ